MRSRISALISNRSLRSRLIIILSLISLLVWFIATGAEWYKFRKEMNKQFDTQLILFAERLASSNIVEGYHEVMAKKEKIAKREVNDDALGFAIFSEKGEPLFSDGRDGKYIEFRAQEGFHQSLFTEEDGDVDLWRVFWLKHHDIYIAVGHEMEYREELIFDVMLSKFWGGIIALPLMMFAIWFIVTRELATLKRLAQEVKQRKPDDTLAIEASQLPNEIRPLVESLNHYFERTNTMFSRERRFTSDAAHELRSPLAGLRIQTEIAQMTMDDPEAHQRALANMTGSIDRIAQLIEQLLTLSRLESLQQLSDKETIDWQSLIESNVSQLYHQAEQKGTDIAVEVESKPQNQQGKPLLLNLVLRNLIDNAINYTPNGSQIQVKLSQTSLVVEDNGNGVSDEDLARLGQPFYRPVDRPVQSDKDEKGSGLGISIIKRIVELHGFRMQLSRSHLGGLKAEIFFL